MKKLITLSLSLLLFPFIYTYSQGVPPGSLTCVTTATNVNCNGDSDGTATVAASSSGIDTCTYVKITVQPNDGYFWDIKLAEFNTGINLISAQIPFTNTLFVDSICYNKNDTLNFILKNFSASAGICGNGGYYKIEVDGIVIDSCGTPFIGNQLEVKFTAPPPPLPTFTYMWSNAATTQTISGLSANTYTVTISDGTGATCTATAMVNQPPAVVATCSSTNVSIPGGNDGTAIVSASGGTPGYTYDWSSGGTKATITNLTAGTYTAIITDANGCKDTCFTIISSPQASCNAFYQYTLGLCPDVLFFDGSTVSQGNIVSWLWEFGDGTSSTQQNPQHLYKVNGNYTACLIITTDNGCIDTICDVIPINCITPPALTCTGSASAVTCNGGSDGTANVNVTGGSSNYSYSWSNNSTMQSISGLIAGTYTVTVSDVTGANCTRSMVVSEPTAIAINAFAFRPAYCDLTGQIVSDVTGGIPPYSYQWSNGATDSTFFDNAGTYTVTVTDANSCTATATAVLNNTSITIFQVGAPFSQDDTCGLGVGKLTVGVAGDCSGQCSGSFLWNTGATTGTISGLTAGTYTVIATVGVCVDTATYVLGNYCTTGSITCTAGATDVSCNGADDGAVTVTPSGGVPPYTYLWSDALSQNAATATGLKGGTYTVTVTDAKQSTTTCSAFIFEPAALQLSLIPTNASCAVGSDGSISLAVTGGASPYSFLWSNNATTQNISGLIPGLYMVTVTDNNQCSAQKGAFVSGGSGPLNVTCGVLNPISCFGATDGSVIALASGGTAPYCYAWVFTTSSCSDTLANLGKGTYTVIVSDANGCSGTCTVSLTEPDMLSCSATGTDPKCYGANDGTATAIASGGGGGLPFGGPAGGSYDYLWSDGQTLETATGLIAGTYTVTVSDDNQCSSTCSVTLTQPTELILSKTDTFCFIQYGIGNYQDGAELTSVSAGDVTVTVTANANQGKPDKVIIFNSNSSGTPDLDLEVDLGNLMILPDNVTDANSDLLVDVPNDNQYGGTITLDFSDNVKVVSFKYVDQDDPNPSYARAYDASNALVSSVTINNGGNGSVQVFAMNADNIRKLEFELAGSGAIAELELACPTAVGQGSNGSIDLTVSGGTPNYTYSWSNGATTQDLIQVPPGFYVVTVSDANGCSKTCSTLLSSPNLPISNCNVTREITCNGGNDGEVSVQVIGGLAPYNIQWSTGASGNTISNCTAGPYSITITDANGFVAYESMILGEPVEMDDQISTNDATTICTGESVLLEAVYDPTCTYQWYKYNNHIAGATDHTYIAGVKGPFKVEITNSTGCVTWSNAINVYKHPTPQAYLSALGSTKFCPGGSVALSVNYEAGNTYVWKRKNNVVSTVGNTYTATKSGHHKVIVTNAEGCVKTSNQKYITKYRNPRIVLDEPGPVDICQGSTIDLTAIPSVTPGPYTYMWYRYGNLISGAVSPTYTVTQTGGYNARVTDGNGCSKKSHRTIVTRINCAPRTFDPQLSVYVYPNPFSDEINTEIIGEEDKPLRIAIYNVLGELMYEKDIADIYSLNRITLSGLVSGVYLMEVRQGTQVQHVKMNKVN